MRFMTVSFVSGGLSYPTVSYTTVSCDWIFLTQVSDDRVPPASLELALLDPRVAREPSVSRRRMATPRARWLLSSATAGDHRATIG